MPIIPKQMIVFDLDGTLAVSKQALDGEMAELIRKLLRSYKVAVISGGFFEQYEKQFLSNLAASEEEMRNLILLPTSGSVMYLRENGGWKELYCNEIEKKARENIIASLNEAIDHFGFRPEVSYGELVEDRRTQVTYSGLGQLAPPEAKAAWDPNREKREIVVGFLKDRLEGYSIRIGGMTSVDITLPGIDKAYGIHMIEEHLGIAITDMVFVGDALQEGGNDAPAKTTGVECVEVKDVEDTKAYIRSIL